MQSCRVLIPIALAILACSPDRPLLPDQIACASGADLRALETFEGSIVRGADLECIRLRGDAEYIVVPQFLGEGLPYVYQPFLIGGPGAPISAAIHADARELGIAEGGTPTAQQRLHDVLRHQERRGGTRSIALRQPGAVADLVLTREFSVLATLSEPLRFTRITATLRFGGAHVLLYVDDRAAMTYSEAELARLGVLYDTVLYGVDRAAFGAESDVDANGRIIVLFTPAVNALVPAAECATFGFATGFFYGIDLASTSAESNRGEIFYALTPDPDGIHSCAHTKADVEQVLPATFLHEVQHMVSYGRRVVAGAGAPEVPWLNEGLSHVAEELGSLHYELKYPPPTGRTRPEQLFPDSAAPLIIGNVLNSYRFLRFSQQYSVVACAPGSYCYTAERGGAWLFLRWLADATADPSFFETLVQSGLSGRENIESATGRKAADLFGQFALALWADSIAGFPRTSAEPRLRFATRNLRRVYSTLYDAYGPLGGVPERFPIVPADIGYASRVRSAIRPGTLQVFRVSASHRQSEVAISLTSDSGAPLRTEQEAQLSILRVPHND